MHSILYTVLAIIAIGAILEVVRRSAWRSEQAAYEKNGALFTPAERIFLDVLDQAIGQRFRIMGKVRLGDIIKVKATSDRSAWQRATNQIQQKHVDFAVCDPATLDVRFVIELDDASHAQVKRQERDAFVDKALQSAGILIHRFAVKRTYSVQEVQKTLLAGTATRTIASSKEL